MSQTSRTLATLSVLLVLGLGVGLYAWKGVYEPDQKETQRKDVDERLFSVLNADERGGDGATKSIDFVKLKVTYAGQTTVVERATGTDAWRMTAPVEASVDKSAIEGMVSQLQSSKFKYVADENPDQAADEKYGLSKPTFVVEAEALAGPGKDKRTVRIVGGAENSFNGSIFIRRNDEKKVWGADGSIKWSFQKSSLDLRDKTVFTLDEAKLTRIEVKTRNNRYSLTKNAEGKFTVETEKPGRGEEKSFIADPPTISGAIGQLSGERALSFPDAPPMSEPFETILFVSGSERVELKLWKLPGGDAGAERVIALSEGPHGKVLAEVSNDALSHFDRRPWDLRDRSLLPFNKDAVAKLVVHLSDGTEVAVEKEMTDGGPSESWKVTSPRPGKAKQYKIAAALWTMSAMKATDVIEDQPKDVRKYGFDRWISLRKADNQELAQLTIGGDIKDKPGQKYVRGTRNQVVAGDSGQLSDLPLSLDDLLESQPASDGGEAH